MAPTEGVSHQTYGLVHYDETAPTGDELEGCRWGSSLGVTKISDGQAAGAVEEEGGSRWGSSILGVQQRINGTWAV